MYSTLGNMWINISVIRSIMCVLHSHLIHIHNDEDICQAGCGLLLRISDWRLTATNTLRQHERSLNESGYYEYHYGICEKKNHSLWRSQILFNDSWLSQTRGDCLMLLSVIQYSYTVVVDCVTAAIWRKYKYHTVVYLFLADNRHMNAEQ